MRERVALSEPEGHFSFFGGKFYDFNFYDFAEIDVYIRIGD